MGGKAVDVMPLLDINMSRIPDGFYGRGILLSKPRMNEKLSFVVLLTGLVLRRVVRDAHLVPLPHVAVDGVALVRQGEVANLAAVQVAHYHLKSRYFSL